MIWARGDGHGDGGRAQGPEPKRAPGDGHSDGGRPKMREGCPEPAPGPQKCERDTQNRASEAQNAHTSRAKRPGCQRALRADPANKIQPGSLPPWTPPIHLQG